MLIQELGEQRLYFLAILFRHRGGIAKQIQPMQCVVIMVFLRASHQLLQQRRTMRREGKLLLETNAHRLHSNFVSGRAFKVLSAPGPQMAHFFWGGQTMCGQTAAFAKKEKNGKIKNIFYK